MQKIFSLDLGVASIGWAVMLQHPENEELNEILDCGVRIVPLDSKTEKDEYTKGGNVGTNVARRMARGARRNLQRFRLRRYLLYRALTRLDMMPDQRLLTALTPRELFGLRDKALREPLTLPELGRVLLHLNLRRGYKSNQRDKGNEEKEKKADSYLGQIEARERELDDKGQTIGQRFAIGLRNDPHYRVRQQIFNRDTYAEEFDAIWAAQMPHHPNVLTEANRRWLRDKIIFRQRPLKSAKHLVGECALEWNYALDKSTHQPIVLPNGLFKKVSPKCAPKSSPLNQVCKVWESIHNLRVYDERGVERPITLEEKRQIFNVLQQEERALTATRLLKDILKISPKAFTVDALIKEKGLESNRTRAKLLSVFQKTGIQCRDLLEFSPVIEEVEWDNPESGERIKRLQLRGDFDQQPLYQLWHLIYATQEEKDLVRLLQERYDFTLEQAKALAEIDFTSAGYASKSHRAMRRLLPHLENGLDYTNACKAAGYNHSNSLTKAENQARILSSQLHLNTVLPKNSLRNPVVEKILSQMINLVNALLIAYGQPDEIRIELARELRQSAKERQRTDRNNRDKEKENKRIRQLIADDLGIQAESVTRGQIDKWKLGEETDWLSLYTGKKVERKAFLTGELVDVEHIIPKVRRFDDSYANKTFCERKLNQDKDKWTAHDFMKAQPVEGLQSYDDYLKTIKSLLDAGKISKTKYRNLMLTAEDIANDKDQFLARQLKETQYITKKAREILLEVCHSVLTTTGGITDFLRHQWGWDEVIQDLRLPQFREMGKTKFVPIHKGTQQKEVIDDWDKRKDHRHHALDAIVVGCTRRAHIKRINDLNQTLEGQYGQQRQHEMRQQGRARFLSGPAPFAYNQVSEAIENVLVSFKQSQKLASPTRNRKGSKNGDQMTLTPRGAFHKETIYGRIKRYAEKRTPLNARFQAAWVEKIAHQHERELVAARLAAFDNDPKRAFKDLEKNPILYGKHQHRQLTSVTLWEDWYVAREAISTALTGNKIGYIVDGAAKKAVSSRFEAAGADAKKAFDKLGENPVAAHQVIRRVRILNPAERMIALPRGYAKSEGNHHIAIYRDADGKKHEHVVTFWDAFQRVAWGLPAVIEDVHAAYAHVEQLGEKVPDTLYLPDSPDWTFVVSLAINDMFVFDLDPAEIDFKNPKNRKKVSERLFKVRKLSSGNFWFLHHTETEILEDNTSKKYGRARFASMASLTGSVKVKISHLGQIVAIASPV